MVTPAPRRSGRDLFFAHHGHVRRRHLDDQIDQAPCLTLVTNACVLWTTTYLGDTIDALRNRRHRGHRRDRSAPDPGAARLHQLLWHLLLRHRRRTPPRRPPPAPHPRIT